MNAAVLLLTMGIADLVMLACLTVRSRGLAISLILASTVSWAAIVSLGLGYGWIACAFVLVGIGWALILASPLAPKLIIPVAAVAVLILTALILVPTLARTPSGLFQTQWQASGASVPFAVVVAGVAVAVFLGHTSNVIVRSALTLARRGSDDRPPAPASDDQASAWIVSGRWRWARVQVTPPPSEAPRMVSMMRGGRWIGPLERWVIAAVGLAGAPAIIGAIMAGKGIVRFPEINADRGIGSKAEEFLVGSLLSWALAGAGIAFLVGVATLTLSR